MSTFAQHIQDLVEFAWKLQDTSEYLSWSSRTAEFLNAALGSEAGATFSSLGGDKPSYLWVTYRDRQIGHLEGLALRIESVGLAQSQPEQAHPGSVGGQADAKT